MSSPVAPAHLPAAAAPASPAPVPPTVVPPAAPAAPPAPTAPAAPASHLHWTEGGTEHSALWRSESGFAAPARVVVVDDTLTADAAYRMVQKNTALLWHGDYHNARQLLQALGRRLDRGRRPHDADLTQAFRRHRTEAERRARLLGLLLVPLDADFGVPLRRAPDVRAACAETWGAAGTPAANQAPGAVKAPAASQAPAADPAADPAAYPASVTPLRELIGIVGAHEWRQRGVAVPALGGDRIHAHYGVFSPIRGEYLSLVEATPLPAATAPHAENPGELENSEQPEHPEYPGNPGHPGLIAFDIGTGTGVIAAILARRGVGRVIGTDMSPRALVCATENMARLGVADRVTVLDADLFPAGRAHLVVCNPPWIPAGAVTATDHAVYDPDSAMLRGFLRGLRAHLLPGGEGWLIISDIAERLGLRSRGTLLDLIDDAGLTVVTRHDTRPTHARAQDASDPLHAARSAEITSLWVLRAAG